MLPTPTNPLFGQKPTFWFVVGMENSKTVMKVDHINRPLLTGIMFHLIIMSSTTMPIPWMNGHQGGSQMSENVDKFIAINFPHLNNTLKLPKNTDLRQYWLHLFPLEHETRLCTHSVQSRLMQINWAMYKFQFYKLTAPKFTQWRMQKWRGDFDDFLERERQDTLWIIAQWKV